jgi:hypothetical protein|uniref:Uncharacterized protein n=1 Tax=Zea mays TaxID=4577 RepID=A0A804MCE9_MAIZE
MQRGQARNLERKHLCATTSVQGVDDAADKRVHEPPLCIEVPERHLHPHPLRLPCGLHPPLLRPQETLPDGPQSTHHVAHTVLVPGIVPPPLPGRRCGRGRGRRRGNRRRWRRRRGQGRGSGLGLGKEGRGRAVEEIHGVEERAWASAVGPEASAELLDLVAALPGGLGRGGRGYGGPVGGGQVLPADGEAARGVGPREREGLVGRPARRRHAAAGGAGGGRRGRRGHGGGGPGGDGEAVVEDGMDGEALGYNGGVPLRRQQVAVGARGRRWAAAAAAPTAARGGTLTDTPRGAGRATRKISRWASVPFRPPFRLLDGCDASGGHGRRAPPWTPMVRLCPLLGNNVFVSGAEMEFGFWRR